jgi:hypothetical protein
MTPNSEENQNANRRGLFRLLSEALRGPKPDPAAPKPKMPRAYIVRKRRLPDTFTDQDWQRALEYWGHQCAVCGRPRGLWHTLAADHWIPLSDPDCPGTIPTNIVPLCHGEGGCNNSKRSRSPQDWLEAKLGRKQAFQKLIEIDAYFLWVKDLFTERLGCPVCGEPVLYSDEDSVWFCTYCDAEWTTQDARRFQRCPSCDCWMVPASDPDHPEDADAPAYHCPRCKRTCTDADLLPPEACPGCGERALEWDYEPDGPACGYWRCTACRKEWVFESESAAGTAS